MFRSHKVENHTIKKGIVLSDIIAFEEQVYPSTESAAQQPNNKNAILNDFHNAAFVALERLVESLPNNTSAFKQSGGLYVIP